MPRIPLEKQLKKKAHRTVAFAQDVLAGELYHHFPEAIIHGGTAIWRCYGGNRFSEGIDAYTNTVAESAFDSLVSALERNGFTAEKFKSTGNTIFSRFSYHGEQIRFEAVAKVTDEYTTRRFMMTDGSAIVVNTLSPEQLLQEKAQAYRERRKIRDLYDVFFLLNHIEDPESVTHSLRDMVESFERPVDEASLRTIILTGAVPKTEDMLTEIRRWVQ